LEEVLPLLSIEDAGMTLAADTAPQVESCIIAGFPIMSTPGDITVLLDRLANGDRSVEESLMSQVYMELHRLAAFRMKGERQGHTMQPTALLHEAYVRLCRSNEIEWHDRTHFFRVAGRLMRRILVDYARQHQARKRNNGSPSASMELANVASSEDFAATLEVNDALDALAESNPRLARVVEMRFYAGLTDSEIAEALGLSERTVKRDWFMARAWLHQRLKRR
jgi:RNA polymerase sigma-70 factor, ECF subfamily